MTNKEHGYASDTSAATWQIPSRKMVVLLAGGAVGLGLVILGCFLTWHWWDTLTSGRAAWKGWKPWMPVLSVLGGLAIMFVSLLTLRSEERTNPSARRLIYGYNAVLTGLLLFAVLGVVDMLAVFYRNDIFDWTATSIYSVSPISVKILEQLEKPVKVYVLFSADDDRYLYDDIDTLLSTCRSHTDKLERASVTSPAAFRKLFNDYALQSETAVLVVYDPDGQNTHQAFTLNDLEDASTRFSSQERNRAFKGEQAIISAIQGLERGKITQTVYFTQDSGEMKLSEFEKARDPRRLDRGLGALKGILEKNSYTVKDWNLTQIDPKTRATAPIPDDAAIVVIAGPTELLDPETGPVKIKALEDYMKRPEARLFVLLDTDPYAKDGIKATGLEGFLAKYGIQIGNDIVIHPPFNIASNPTTALVRLAAGADKGFQEAFDLRTQPFIGMMSTRTVQPIETPSPQYTTSRFLETYQALGRDGVGQWPETNLRGDPREFIQQLSEKQPTEFEAKMLKSPVVSVAVTVREKTGNSSMPNDPIHGQLPGESKPRIIVFGSDNWVSNTVVQNVSLYPNLFVSCLAWLGERQKEILVSDIPPKERKSYRFNTKPSDINSMVFTPLFVLLIAIVGCGLGVWFMRKR